MYIKQKDEREVITKYTFKSELSPQNILLEMWVLTDIRVSSNDIAVLPTRM